MNDRLLSMAFTAQDVISTTAASWGLRRMRSLPLSLIAVAILAACSASLPPIEAEKLPPTPAAYKEQAGSFAVAPPAEAQPRGEWWKTFSDPVLDELVARAERGSTTVRIAAARLAQARAFVRASDSARLPQVEASAGAGRGRGFVNGVPVQGTSGLFTAGADLSYEVDLFGRLRQASDAARLDAQASEGLLQSTRLLVQAQVAQTYLELRALDAELGIVRTTLDTYRDTLALTERRWRAGDVAELEVTRVNTELASTESDALALERRRTELEHALAVLLGEAPTAFALAPQEWRTALPNIPAGVPSTLLTRRPDVSAAQKSLLAAQTRVGVAKAAWFPSFALTASGGYASTDLSDLFKWSSRAWGLGVLGALPLFDGGRRKAGIEAAGAEFDAAAERYREQVLVAFKDVEDQLAALRLLSRQADAQARAVRSASRSTALSDVRYRNGYISQLELLDSLRSELRNRRQELQVRSAQYQATVALVRALGGSWDAL
jgi:multidrug efflux system outer membrane protein